MGGVKKSVYIFLCSLLGAMLFLVLHRLAVFTYLIITIYGGPGIPEGAAYVQFVAIDYITLFFALLFGSWYGIWLGSYWYEMVYERGIWPGAFLHHARGKLFFRKNKDYGLREKIETIKEKLEQDLSQAESLVAEIPRPKFNPPPIKRRASGKKSAARKPRMV
jgi:hypothetical protein